MADEGKDFAQRLLRSGETSFFDSYTISEKNQTVEDSYVVIFAVRTNRKGRDRLRNLSDTTKFKAVAGPSGQPCPMCNGTGKI